MSADALPPLPSMADVLDALNVFNRPKPSEDDGPWQAEHFIRVDYLPEFIHNVGRAWYGAPLLRRIEDMQAEMERLRAERANPVAWIRRHPDGLYSDDLMPEWQIERVRKESGAWVPLYAAPQAAPAPTQASERLRLALERVTTNYRLTLAGKPVRDVSETLAECDAALRLNGLEQP